MQSESMTAILLKDLSTVKKHEIEGLLFSWGQNIDGQLGTINEQIPFNETNYEIVKSLHQRLL